MKPLLFMALSLLAILCLSACTTTKHVPNYDLPPQEVTVANDHGGYVRVYARDLQYAMDMGIKVKLRGHCDSACTMFMALPQDQLCMYPGTILRYHEASGGTPAENEYVTQVIYRLYPEWLQSWIISNGGITKELKVVPYHYSEQFVSRCV